MCEKLLMNLLMLKLNVALRKLNYLYLSLLSMSSTPNRYERNIISC